MIRKFLTSSHSAREQQELKRDNEIQRIETFSDGVFAFAVTLLIVSLEVPKTYEELLISMRGFFAFGISFLILVSIWSEQHRFFRNYGMKDGWTIALNACLLFIVLFYTYPLKFLFTLIFRDTIYGPNKSPLIISSHQMPSLMIIYALGFIAIYSLFFLMYLRAWRQSKARGYTSLEIFDCKSSMYKELILVLTGLCSLLIACFFNEKKVYLAGLIFTLAGPAIGIFYFYRKKRRKLIRQTPSKK
jgi:uncharacterized membrane protein